MRINLAKSAGFCFGVRRAIDIALKTAKTKKYVYMLGDIVHNEDVVNQIRKSGIKKIKRITSQGKDKTFLIRAHGIGLDIIKKMRCLGYKIIDATCPMVKEIHKIAQSLEKNGYTVIIIGDRAHDEVRGILGQLKKKAIVIDKPENINLKIVKTLKKAAVVVQSTQNIDNVLEILSILKTYIKKLKFVNTICRPTQLKQAEIKIMPLKNDIMIIIGSKDSANTKRLYEISKSLNKSSYWVGSKTQIKKSWFKNVSSVGVAAGASTPHQTIQEIIGYLKQIK